jgi:hypothetical protein
MRKGRLMSRPFCLAITLGRHPVVSAVAEQLLDAALQLALLDFALA